MHAAWLALCGLTLLIIPAFPHLVSVDNDVLTIVIEGRRTFKVKLGQPRSLYAVGHEPLGWNVKRRSGSTGSVSVAIVQRNGSMAHAHVGALWEGGTLELNENGGKWEMPHVDEFKVEQARRLKAWAGKAFTPCWTGQDAGMREVKIGFACDKGFVSSIGESPMVFTENMMSMTNLVYENQLSVHLSIGTFLMPSEWGGGMNQDVRPCPTDISGRLDTFRKYAFNTLHPKYAGHGTWAQLTDCFRPVAGLTTVGLAYVNVVCKSSYSQLVTTQTGASSWMIFAHELGHNFGAGHSFEDGQGSTGGIMDYGDGKFQGVYQFHPYRKKEMCSAISKSMLIKSCWRAYDPDAAAGAKWDYGDWGPCDIACSFVWQGKGKQYRVPECFNKDKVVIPDQYCKLAEKSKFPPFEQPCAVPQCPGDVRWEFLPWGTCKSPYNFTCGAGRAEQDPTCVDKKKKTPGSGKDCPAPAPAPATRACTLPENRTCEDPSRWVPGDGWLDGPECSNEDAYQVQELHCVDTTTLLPSRPGKCPPIKPLAAFRPVEAPACPASKDPCCEDTSCHAYTSKGDCKYQSRHLDAIACVTNPNKLATLYKFLGGLYSRSDGCLFDNAPQSMYPIADGFPGFPAAWTRVDAALSGPFHELMLFSGGSVLRFSVEAHKTFAGYPKATSDEFPGLADACPKCATRVAAAIFDPQNEVLQLWCGFGEVYCVSNQAWRSRHDSSKKWTLRPSQDFGMAAVRGAFQNDKGILTLIGPDGDRFEMSSSTSEQTPVPLPFFGKAADIKKCGNFAFCGECDSSGCKTCQKGFVRTNWGHCVTFRSQAYLDFTRGGTDDETLSRSGARSIAEFNSWVMSNTSALFLQGPAAVSKPGLKMAPVKGNGEGPKSLRRWAFSVWVKSRNGGTGPLLTAQQQGDDALTIVWESCGPSVLYKTAGKVVWQLPCDEHTFGDVSNRWVRVGMDFQSDFRLRVNDHEIRAEPKKHLALDKLVFDDWTLGGGADLDVSLVQILDYDEWPPVVEGIQGQSWQFIAAAIAVLVLGLCCLFLTWRVKAPEGMEYMSQTFFTTAVEAYVGFLSVAQISVGVGAMVGVLMVMAFGTLGNEVGLLDLFAGLFNGEFVYIIWPLGIGFAIFLTGLVGLRMARTRDCCWINLHWVFLIFVLYKQYRVMEYFGLLPNDQLGIMDSSLWTQVQSGIRPEGRPRFRRTFYRSFVTLMGRERYDCSLLDRELGSCAAKIEEGTAIMQCTQPYASARAFQKMVNAHCAAGVNVTRCASCAENFGFAAGVEDWNPTEPANRVWCKCAAKFYETAEGWLASLGSFGTVLMVAEVLLLICVLYLSFIAPAKQELLTRKLARVREFGERHQERGQARAAQVRTAGRTAVQNKRTTAGQCVQLFALMQFILALPFIYIGVSIVSKPNASLLPAEVILIVFMPASLLVTLSWCGCSIDSEQTPTGSMYVVIMFLLVVVMAMASILNFGGPQELHFAGMTGIPNITSLMLQKNEKKLYHADKTTTFTSLFDRDAFDCKVLDDGRQCNATGGIQCKKATADYFQSFVNSNCVASQACDMCLDQKHSAHPLDPLDPLNRIWCKCAGALEMVRINSWVWMVGLSGLHAFVFVMACCHVCCKKKDSVESRGGRGDPDFLPGTQMASFTP